MWHVGRYDRFIQGSGFDILSLRVFAFVCVCVCVYVCESWSLTLREEHKVLKRYVGLRRTR